MYDVHDEHSGHHPHHDHDCGHGRQRPGTRRKGHGRADSRRRALGTPEGGDIGEIFEVVATGLGDAVERMVRSLEPVPLTDMLARRRPSRHRRPRRWDCCTQTSRCPSCGECDCHCRCCIGDVDLVVYARLGEVRVVPIHIENTRKRELELSLELSEFTTWGGGKTPISGSLATETTVTVEACGAHDAVVVVRAPGLPGEAPAEEARYEERTKSQLLEEARERDLDVRSTDTKGDLVEMLVASDREALETPREKLPSRQRLRDVDECHVAVADLRISGCDVRPIRIAVAVLPRDCGAFEIECGCTCC